MYYADWDHWKKIPKSDLHSVVKLSFGIDPRDEGKIPSTKRNPCGDSNFMPEDLFNERHDIAIANLNHGLDIDAFDSHEGRPVYKVSLSKFATWALHHKVGIHPELAAMAGAKNDTEINAGKNNESAQPYETKWLTIQDAAIRQFFNPRRDHDAKLEEVVAWIKSEAKAAGLSESDRIPKSIFTIIKPANHDPKKKRVKPLE